ncbi:hypothetical protein YTPLAS18_08790 [Nitrospira sp.]|nr:hypothetical protein YTPLAS18_08790 [Nitrospira sp.]
MDWHDSEDSSERTFSLTEANELIPTLHLHLTRIRHARRTLEVIQDDIHRASLRAEYGGGSRYGVLYLQALEQVSRNLQALEETGVLLKDVETGLCDFPHRYEGRIVYLCWKLGEDEVAWWHEIHAGFQGRQSITRLG